MPDYAGRLHFDALDNLLIAPGIPGGFLPTVEHRRIGVINAPVQDLNAGALQVDYTPAVIALLLGEPITLSGRVLYMAIHFSAAVNQTVTVTLIYAGAATHNVVFVTTVLVNATDWVWIPDDQVIVEVGDTARIDCTNVGAPAVNAFATYTVQEIP